MKENSGNRVTASGRNVYTHTWLPDETAKSNIILVHGIGEHCGRYQHVAEFLTSQGHAVYGGPREKRREARLHELR